MAASASTGSLSGNKARLFYFDLLRAFACLSVVMIHASAQYAMKEAGSTDFWIGNLFDSISRAAVPIFVMLSGALMLDENYRFTKKKWLQHIGKMLSFFLFWSVCYTLLYQVGIPLIRHEQLDVFTIIWSLLKGHFHLWFVPMIIGLYLIVPLLRLWVNHQNRQYVEYFLLLSFIFAYIMPQILQILVCINARFEDYYDLLNNTYINYPLGFSSYFVLGWYLHHYELPRKKLIGILGMASICMMVWGTYAEFAYTDSKKFIFYDYFSVNVLLYSVAVFVLIKSLYGKKQYTASLLHKAVTLICNCSLGIYAVHAAAVSVVIPLVSQLHALIAVPFIFIICTVLSVIASLILSRIPFLKRFV